MIRTVDYWIGPDYSNASLKLLVLGESRYDEEFSDRRVIETRLDGEFHGGQRRTFTNFERAVLGAEYSEADAQSFWRRAIFYNYNRSFFPGRARVRLDYKKREAPENALALQRILTEHSPTHAIVWGITNWGSIDTGPEWSDGIISGSTEPCGVAVVSGHRTLFTRITHPSTAFRSDDWYPIISTFLAMQP